MNTFDWGSNPVTLLCTHKGPQLKGLWQEMEEDR